MCNFCFREKITLEHFLYECEKVQFEIFNHFVYMDVWIFFTINIATEKNACLLGCSENEFLNAINA